MSDAALRLASPAHLLALAEASPTHVAAHDRSAWLALFARTAVIEDPVGSAPHRRLPSTLPAADPLARFFDTFIAENHIRIDASLDIACPATGELVRDVTIHTGLASGLSTQLHAYLLYTCVEEDGLLRIARLAAHWDLRGMSRRVLSHGLRGLWTLCSTSARMLRYQGLRGTLGYSTGLLRGVFSAGCRTLQSLVDALPQGSSPAARALLAPQVRIELASQQDCRPLPLLGFLELAAASPVPLAITESIASGFVVTCRFSGLFAPSSRGILFAHICPDSRRIQALRFFLAA